MKARSAVRQAGAERAHPADHGPDHEHEEQHQHDRRGDHAGEVVGGHPGRQHHEEAAEHQHADVVAEGGDAPHLDPRLVGERDAEGGGGEQAALLEAPTRRRT